MRGTLVSGGISGTFLATVNPVPGDGRSLTMRCSKEDAISFLSHQRQSLVMLSVSALLLLGAFAPTSFDDNAVVDFHFLAMAAPGLNRVCAPPSVDTGADLPVALVYAHSSAPTTPALDSLPDTRQSPAVLATVAESPRGSRISGFAPLDEAIFVGEKDPFVLVRDSKGKEIARGWLPPHRYGVEWENNIARRRPELESPFVDEYEARLDALREDPAVMEVQHAAAGGQTLRELLQDADLNDSVIPNWLRALDDASGPVTLLENQQVSMFLDRRDRSPRLIRIDVDDDSMIVALRNGSSVIADRVAVPMQQRLRAVGGEIQRSLYDSAMAADVPESTVAQMAEVLGWELNLDKLRRGARFRAVYEEKLRTDTGERTAGRVLAVEITDNGRTYEGYYFAERGGDHGRYYTRDAKALGGSLLRYPVAYTRISSYFSDSRFHPIKNRRMPHYGVDFAAPTGTPVVAVGDGVISAAGWAGGSGRLVRIRHDATYVSAYAHLARIAPGIVPGTHVKQGQLIGYVGSSGLATGPHLHYAVFRDGRYVDPLKVVIGPNPELDGIARTAFQLALGTVDDAFDRAGLNSDAIVQLSMAPAAR